MSVQTQIPLLPIEQLERRRARANSALGAVWDLLDTVKDPEIPVLSIWDLGILRDVRPHGDGITVVITPTYSGCPAMDAIAQDVVATLQAAGYENVSVDTQLTPAWTTSWLSDKARENLQNYGIAAAASGSQLACPQCQSQQVELISEFGSTACKSLYKCSQCHEPFDYFKPL